MRHDIICLAGGAIAGALIASGVTFAVASQPIVISDTIGVTNTAGEVDGSYKYAGLEYKQGDGKLIVELKFERR